ncbi:MAG: multicopper oxidase domain-containing protein [Flavobacteriales bacterium]|jgi:hypothetical protein|nr:multicopper oxidase domain-containing protein [Flavobacteriales bacterium]MBT3964251.1 multicopper oxidase domain-containing protein [Flavobacteriales bacterium]MBT4930100.1 multicopper oxidase domain-containing protein [Flavobacteriales bacterium]MBT5133058.1 multicopper oxidase domain-containing protein [Flavobacteriales bacterium]MBT7749819.1 multicopper oxidase domain-containing protein [Flavobacteriales bacterium]
MKLLTIHIACFLILSLDVYSQQVRQIIGRNVGWKTLSDGNNVRVFGFADNLSQYPDVPGPTLEFTEGDSVIIDFWNISQGAPHTIHLHGLDVNQENDGVPHLSFEVHHMEHGFYRFRAPAAGTYLYHCHVVSSIHVQAGMYGLIVIHPPSGENYSWEGGYEIHRDHRLFMSEIDTVWHNDTVLLHEYDTTSSMHHVKIPIYDPQHFLVNGLGQSQLIDSVIVTGQVDENIYVRLANIGYYKNIVVLPSGLNARIVSSDGRPLSTEIETDSVVVYPGERFGVLCQASEEFESEISVVYSNLNTGVSVATEVVEVDISGFLGIDDSEHQPEVRISPNPADDFVTIDVLDQENDEVLVKLIDPNSRVLDVFQITQKRTRYDVSYLPSGTFFFYFPRGEEKWTLKWVKK